MTSTILEAYQDVERAMDRYNQVLADLVATLQASEGADHARAERLSHGARAMRDSSMIYLSYAKFIAHGMPESEDLIQDDLQA